MIDHAYRSLVVARRAHLPAAIGPFVFVCFPVKSPNFKDSCFYWSKSPQRREQLNRSSWTQPAHASMRITLSPARWHSRREQRTEEIPRAAQLGVLHYERIIDWKRKKRKSEEKQMGKKQTYAGCIGIFHSLICMCTHTHPRAITSINTHADIHTYCVPKCTHACIVFSLFKVCDFSESGTPFFCAPFTFCTHGKHARTHKRAGHPPF